MVIADAEAMQQRHCAIRTRVGFAWDEPWQHDAHLCTDRHVKTVGELGPWVQSNPVIGRASTQQGIGILEMG